MAEALAHAPPWQYAAGATLAVLVGVTVALIIRSSRQWLEDQFFDGAPQFEFTLGAVVTIAVFFLLQTAGFVPYVLNYLSADGTTAYGAMLAAFTALLGFAVAVLAIVCTVIPTTRLRPHMSSDQYREFLGAFTITIRTIGACTLLSLLAMFLNKSSHARETLFFVVFFAVVVAIPGLARSALALEQVVRIIAYMPPSKPTHRPSNRPRSEPESPT